jgi:hypothetical protein
MANGGLYDFGRPDFPTPTGPEYFTRAREATRP